jgi:NADPH-dependent curcumin reductase CurA
MTTNRQIIIAELPKGRLESACFRLVESEAPAPGPGEVLVRTKIVSLDAANRA